MPPVTGATLHRLDEESFLQENDVGIGTADVTVDVAKAFISLP